MSLAIFPAYSYPFLNLLVGRLMKSYRHGRNIGIQRRSVNPSASQCDGTEVFRIDPDMGLRDADGLCMERTYGFFYALCTLPLLRAPWSVHLALFCTFLSCPCTLYPAPPICAIPPHLHPGGCSPVAPSDRRTRFCPRPWRTSASLKVFVNFLGQFFELAVSRKHKRSRRIMGFSRRTSKNSDDLKKIVDLLHEG